MAVTVARWEELCDGNAVPVCQPNTSRFVDHSTPRSNDDMLHHYIHATLNNCPAVQQNARYCRKLIKNGYRCTRPKLDCDSPESDLKSFLYHHVCLKSCKCIEEQGHDFYFNRNVSARKLTESCFATDDYGIALLKFMGRNLRCCYLDLSTCLPKHGNISFVPTNSSVHVYKRSVWILGPEVYLMNFEYNTPVVRRIVSNVPVGFDHQNKLSINAYTVMVSGCHQYIHDTNSKNSLILKSIPDELFSNATCNVVVGNLCVMKGVDRKLPPKLYICSLTPEIKVQNVVDFSVVLRSSKQIFPCESGYELLTPANDTVILLKSYESYVIVFDLVQRRISQILTYIDCFWQHKLSIMMSPNGNEIRLVGAYQEFMKPMWNYLSVSFTVWRGITLREIAKHVIRQNFTWSQIKHLDLPKLMLKDLEKSFLH